MKALSIILAVLLVAAIGAGAYFTLQYRDAQEELDLKNDKIKEQEFRIKKLEDRVDEISKQLEEEIARVSQEKEQEIERLRNAQNQLVDELKTEIEDKQIQIKQLADKLSVSMVDKILFPSGRAELTDEGLKVLERVGNIIKKVEDKIIRVEGHTDNVPIHPRLQDQFPTNWELSTARATNVVRFLEDKVRIDPRKLQAVGLSQHHPVASNKTVAGREAKIGGLKYNCCQLNRRSQERTNWRPTKNQKIRGRYESFRSC